MSVGDQGDLELTGNDEEVDEEVAKEELTQWVKKWYHDHHEWRFEGITDEEDISVITAKLVAIYYEEYKELKKGEDENYSVEQYIKDELVSNRANIIALEDLSDYKGYVSQELENWITQIYNKL